jgi:hypothetical protein
MLPPAVQLRAGDAEGFRGFGRRDEFCDHTATMAYVRPHCGGAAMFATDRDGCHDCRDHQSMEAIFAGEPVAARLVPGQRAVSGGSRADRVD